MLTSKKYQCSIYHCLKPQKFREVIYRVNAFFRENFCGLPILNGVLLPTTPNYRWTPVLFRAKQQTRHGDRWGVPFEIWSKTNLYIANATHQKIGWSCSFPKNQWLSSPLIPKKKSVSILQKQRYRILWQICVKLLYKIYSHASFFRKSYPFLSNCKKNSNNHRVYLSNRCNVSGFRIRPLNFL